MTRIIELPEILDVLKSIRFETLMETIEAGFVAFDEGKVMVPPVGYMHFDDPPGDMHIKYGAIKNDENYVIKIAAGFYDNPKLGLPVSTGLLLVFSQKNGQLQCILNDKRHLTNIRTGLAGAVCAKYFAPKHVDCIGLIGAGVQNELQLEYLSKLIDCKKVIVCGREGTDFARFQQNVEHLGLNIKETTNVKYLTSTCKLIVCATPANKPHFTAEDILPGTHITALGADAPGKQEIPVELFKKADIVVVDHKQQCIDHGDLSWALKDEYIKASDVLTLGSVIKSGQGRENEEQITVADLTGVAVQDIQMANLIHNHAYTLA